jgi:hypothetical protein
MLRKSVLTFLVLGLNLSFLNSAQALDIDVDIQTMNTLSPEQRTVSEDQL